METALSTMSSLLDTFRELHGSINPDEIADAASDIAQVLRTEGEKDPENREHLVSIVNFFNQELDKVNELLRLAGVKTSGLPRMREGLVAAGYLTDGADMEENDSLPELSSEGNTEDDTPALPEIPTGGIGFEIREGNKKDGAPIERYVFSVDSPPIKLGTGTNCHIKRGNRILMAYIERTEDKYQLVAIGRYVFINGEESSQKPLTDGDNIYIGDTCLWVIIPS